MAVRFLSGLVRTAFLAAVLGAVLYLSGDIADLAGYSVPVEGAVYLSPAAEKQVESALARQTHGKLRLARNSPTAEVCWDRWIPAGIPTFGVLTHNRLVFSARASSGFRDIFSAEAWMQAAAVQYLSALRNLTRSPQVDDAGLVVDRGFLAYRSDVGGRTSQVSIASVNSLIRRTWVFVRPVRDVHLAWTQDSWDRQLLLVGFRSGSSKVRLTVRLSPDGRMSGPPGYLGVALASQQADTPAGGWMAALRELAVLDPIGVR